MRAGRTTIRSGAYHSNMSSTATTGIASGRRRNEMKIFDWRFLMDDRPGAALLAVVLLNGGLAWNCSAETTLLYNAVVHTATGETFTNGGVLIDGQKITLVLDGKSTKRLTVRQM